MSYSSSSTAASSRIYIDDQDHLSAEYMQEKSIGLLQRCGELTAKLQIMMRLRENLIHMPDLITLSSSLIEDNSFIRDIAYTKDSFESKLSTKIEPDFITKEIQRLAPISTIKQLEHIIKEAQHIYESYVDTHNRHQQKLYEQALRNAGLLDQNEEKDGKKRMGDTTDTKPSVSVLDALTAPAADGSTLSDSRALQLSLAHLESLAPRRWKLRERMEKLRTKDDSWENISVGLADQLSKLTMHWERLEEKKKWLMAELGDDGEEDLDGGSNSLANKLRKKLDTLKANMDADQDKYHSMTLSCLAQMKRDAKTAQDLMEEYNRNENSLKKITQLKNGIDLEKNLLNEMEQLKIAGGGKDMDGASQFNLGSGSIQPFLVQFSSDKSRLIAINRPKTALGLLGLEGDTDKYDTHESIDELHHSSPDDKIQWCRTQIIYIQNRMNERFSRLQKKIDETCLEQTKKLQEHQTNFAPELAHKLDTLNSILAHDSQTLHSYSDQVTRALHDFVLRNRKWEEKNSYYQRVHREALVLLQRMGQKADEILA